MPQGDPLGYMTPEMQARFAGLLGMSMLAPPAGAALAAPGLAEMLAGMAGHHTGRDISFAGQSTPAAAPQAMPAARTGRSLNDLSLKELNRLRFQYRGQLSPEQDRRITDRIRQLQTPSR